MNNIENTPNKLTTKQQHQCDYMDKKIRRAQSAISDSLSHLSCALRQMETKDPHEQQLTHLNLVLQYRLDTQNTIKVLLQLHQALSHALGIVESNSQEKNLEIAALSLGKDAMHDELSILHNLSSKLSHILELSKKLERQHLEEKKLTRKLINRLSDLLNLNEQHINNDTQEPKEERLERYKHDISPQSEAIEHELHDAISLQTYFMYSVEQLTEAIQVFGHIPKFGVIYDYLAGIKGPISQFDATLQHSVDLSKQCQDTLALADKNNNQEKCLRQQLNKLNTQLNKQHMQLKKSVLDSANYQQYLQENSTKLLSLNKSVGNSTATQLEQKMTKRRTMRWF